ncbi:MAG TPA: RNA polymerase factor sigma-54 [Syntrophorhabdaceae bacterium]|nr:RNA polymerase factor sigma-54 [Syntrophorhabdaceae bacterium]HOB69025.1 RNA polymerase factor sigma-54 [Syntrophorhabdaceae bacterium]
MLELKQTQKLLPVLTQQLQQAIKLLQMSQLELTEAIEQELKENPILEITENDEKQEKGESQEDTQGDAHEEIDIEEFLNRYTSSEEFVGKDDREYPDYENIVKKSSNLRDYLRWQAGLTIFDPGERVAAEWIIENIDDNGYLAYPIPEIAKTSGFSIELLENALSKVQRFDPTGVGARSLKECIYLQYEANGEKDTILEEILDKYFNMLDGMHLKEISKKSGHPLEKIKEAIDKIKTYDPKPGRNFSEDFTSYVVPDVYVVKGEDGFEVHLNNDDIPELKMNRYYMELYLGKNIDKETKGYIKNKIKQAGWFIKSIQQRQKTLYLVSKSIVKFQEDFFEHGIKFLKPLVLRDVASDIEVHESTVSRITTNKYMSTQHGIFELKFFFPAGIDNVEGGQMSTNVVRNLIAEIVEKEDKSSPLTDDEIVNILKGQHNIKIARRTVAKYRDILNIKSSRERADTS